MSGVDTSERGGGPDLDTGDDRSPPRERRGVASVATNPVVLGAVLALLGVNLSTLQPVFGIDSSFRVGLTQAVLDRMQFGVDVVWPYGPLGFLGGPTAISRGLLAFAVVYQYVALTILFATLTFRLRRNGLGTTWTALVLASIALAIGITDNIVAELVTITIVVILVTLWQENGRLPRPSTWWVVAVAGCVAGAQVLVKFGPGALACAVVVFFAVSSGRRLRQVGIAIAAIVVGFLVPWFATGQSTSTLGPYFRTSYELSAGYQDAQAYGPSTAAVGVVGVVALVVTGIGVLGGYRWQRRDRHAWWALLPLAATAWFALKQGLVRWDDWHAVGAVIMLGVLVAVLPWPRRLMVLPVSVLLVGALVAFAADPGRLRSTWTDRMDAAAILLSASRHESQLDQARAELRASYAVPDAVLDALAGGSVHAEAWDVNAVWGNDLTWEPLPVMQSYATYTPELDGRNAARYASVEGPDGVLLNPATVDGRNGLWESPDARVALTCNFVPAASGDGWTALRRSSNACGPAREIATETVAPGATIDVPEPSQPDALVVARFDLPTDPLSRLLATVARPLRYPYVFVDDTRYRLVRGTAEGAHLLRSPGRVGERQLPHGPVDASSLSFTNVGSGDVVVRFEEIPLAG
jgi:hypothetical protein